jgi:hypothetical protein
MPSKKPTQRADQQARSFYPPSSEPRKKASLEGLLEDMDAELEIERKMHLKQTVKKVRNFAIGAAVSFAIIFGSYKGVEHQVNSNRDERLVAYKTELQKVHGASSFLPYEDEVNNFSKRVIGESSLKFSQFKTELNDFITKEYAPKLDEEKRNARMTAYQIELTSIKNEPAIRAKPRMNALRQKLDLETSSIFKKLKTETANYDTKVISPSIEKEQLQARISEYEKHFNTVRAYVTQENFAQAAKENQLLMADLQREKVPAAADLLKTAVEYHANTINPGLRNVSSLTGVKLTQPRENSATRGTILERKKTTESPAPIQNPQRTPLIVERKTTETENQPNLESAVSRLSSWSKQIPSDYPVRYSEAIESGSNYLMANTVEESEGYNVNLLGVNNNGNPVWSKILKSRPEKEIFSVKMISTGDGGGAVLLNDSTHSLFRFDGAGSIIWQTTLRRSVLRSTNDQMEFTGLSPTRDGGFVLAGKYLWASKNLDFLIVKVASSGFVEWTNMLDNYVKPSLGKETANPFNKHESFVENIGGHGSDSAASVVQTRDGGYILTGTTFMSGIGYDIWDIIVDGRGNSTGRVQFSKQNEEEAKQVITSGDGSYLIMGVDDKNTTILFKMSPNHDRIWQKNYADFISSSAFSVSDGYIFSGKHNGAPSLVKLSSNGELLWNITEKNILWHYDSLKEENGLYTLVGASGGNMSVTKVDRQGNIK